MAPTRCVIYNYEFKSILFLKVNGNDNYVCHMIPMETYFDHILFCSFKCFVKCFDSSLQQILYGICNSSGRLVNISFLYSDNSNKYFLIVMQNLHWGKTSSLFIKLSTADWLQNRRHGYSELIGYIMDVMVTVSLLVAEQAYWVQLVRLFVSDLIG